MPQIREQIAMVHLPPSKTLKYLFHVRKTRKAVKFHISQLFCNFLRKFVRMRTERFRRIMEILGSIDPNRFAS